MFFVVFLFSEKSGWLFFVVFLLSEIQENTFRLFVALFGTLSEHFQNTLRAWFEYVVSSSSFQIAGFAVVVVEGEKGSSWTRTCMHHSFQSPS